MQLIVFFEVIAFLKGADVIHQMFTKLGSITFRAALKFLYLLQVFLFYKRGPFNEKYLLDGSFGVHFWGFTFIVMQIITCNKGT